MVRVASMRASVLALALPLALPQGSSAADRWGDGQRDEDDGGEGDRSLRVEAELALQGPACEERCTVAAVGPGCLAELSYRPLPRELRACAAERIERCRSECAEDRALRGRRARAPGAAATAGPRG
jgi:hypothetical protein